MSLKEKFGSTAEPEDGGLVRDVWRDKLGKIIGKIKPIKLTCPNKDISQTEEYLIVKWSDHVGGIHESKVKHE